MHDDTTACRVERVGDRMGYRTTSDRSQEAKGGGIRSITEEDHHRHLAILSILPRKALSEAALLGKSCHVKNKVYLVHFDKYTLNLLFIKILLFRYF